ncbi:MAG: c-type cytochrome domain-containing protein, partial [Phycisphaerales bacterium JB041]
MRPRADNRRPLAAAMAAGVLGASALLGTLGLTGHSAPVYISAADAFPPGTPVVDFARDIRPILSNNCFLCHGPDPSSREASLRLDTREGLFTARDEKSDSPVVPGDRAASPLWQRITTADAEAHMPPPDSGKSLTPEQVDTIGRGIDAGAPWKNHWSFEPPLEHTAPAVQDE